MIQTHQNEILAYYLYSCDLMDFSTQNVGKRTETVTVLKGLQGIDDFVGKINTVNENKMLIFTKEMKNFLESTMSHKDAIKSIIIEDQLVINEKRIHKHEVQNLMNVMIVTNNINPLKIENSDRRYVVCECNPVHRGDLQDISQFNPRDMLITQAKKDIIRASLSPVDDIIINHLEIKLHAILLKDGNNMI
ncbi:MAG: hypothetical protein EZS28_036785 [Streblomastix strix]|uniref:NrS-1 polymerase-like helicase domain-containing protein n=1 Tax=Streblomastix strix TaxID=222440 RepID=A0A5J4UB52_9EUKA|nr:MAG: hypothetical protein EZS28_036785 [Streblomastix strix]